MLLDNYNALTQPVHTVAWNVRLHSHVSVTFPKASPEVDQHAIHAISVFIYGIHIFLSIDWLKVHHVIKNKLTILQKLGQSRK